MHTESECTLHRVQIDLMDFHSQPDCEFTWVLHIKDHFSKFFTLYALKDKSAAGVDERIAERIGELAL